MPHIACLNCLVGRVEGKSIDTTCIFLGRKEIAHPKNYAPAHSVIKLAESLTLECSKCAQTFSIKETAIKEEHEQFCKITVLHLGDVFNLNMTEDIPRVYEEAAVPIIKNKMERSKLPKKVFLSKLEAQG